MVIGLFGLALVMIVGGVASVVQGFPYVRLESGLAMVIGGASAASAGAILLGLAATVGRLRSLERALLSARPAGAIAFPELKREIPVAPATNTLPLAGAAGLAGVTLPAEIGHTGSALEVGIGAIDRGAAPAPEVEPTLPNLLPAEEPTPAAEPSAGTPQDRREPHFEVEEEVRREPQSSDAVSEQLTLRPSIEEPEPAVEEPKVEDEAQVVGTYASGGNTYVMYSNGSIEADTPKGRFTFDSLDQLKAFIAAGGESGTRGAA